MCRFLLRLYKSMYPLESVKACKMVKCTVMCVQAYHETCGMGVLDIKRNLTVLLAF